jgi:catechol 2,3-dioxygenase-like lactoylglutathione lyase family enzyme
MDQRLSLITLGVGDVSRAQAFYVPLGWHLDGGVDDETDHVAFFQTPGASLPCGTRGKLARDSGVTDTGGWGGVTLATTSARPRRSTPCSPKPERRRQRSPVPAPPPSGAATQACSSTPTATPGRSPTTPAGPCTRTAEQPSTDGRRTLAATTSYPQIRSLGAGGNLASPRKASAG